MGSERRVFFGSKEISIRFPDRTKNGEGDIIGL